MEFEVHPQDFSLRQEALRLFRIGGGVFQRALEIQAQHQLGSGGEGLGQRVAEAAQKAHQGRVLLEDVVKLAFHFAQRGGEDQVEDPALVVAEKRLQRVGNVNEVAVQLPDDVRQVALLEGGASPGDEALVALFVLTEAIGADPGVQIVIPEVQDAEDQVPSCRSPRSRCAPCRWPGEGVRRGRGGPAESCARSPAARSSSRPAPAAESPRRARRRHSARPPVADPPWPAGRAARRDRGPCRALRGCSCACARSARNASSRAPLEELPRRAAPPGRHSAGSAPSRCPRDRRRTSRNSCTSASRGAASPAAARPATRSAAGRARRAAVLREKASHARRRAVEDDVDVVVARRPRIAEQRRRRRLEATAPSSSRSQSSACAQRGRASLVPAGRPPELQPQSLRQRSTPCTQLQAVFSKISTSMRRRMQFQKLAVVGEAARGRSPRCDRARRPAPCRRSDDGGRRSRRRSRCGPAAASRRSSETPPSSRSAKCSPLSSSPSNATPREIGAVVEEEVDASGPRAALTRRRASGRCGRRSRPATRCLRRGRTRFAWCGARIVKRIPCSASTSERLEVDRGLRQPHALGLAAEAVLEIARCPRRICVCLSRAVGERHDHVVVGLRDRRAVAGEALLALAIGLEDAPVDVRRVRLHPGEQRRPEVEADARVVVDDARRSGPASSRMRAAAFGA